MRQIEVFEPYLRVILVVHVLLLRRFAGIRWDLVRVERLVVRFQLTLDFRR